MINSIPNATLRTLVMIVVYVALCFYLVFTLWKKKRNDNDMTQDVEYATVTIPPPQSLPTVTMPPPLSPPQSLPTVTMPAANHPTRTKKFIGNYRLGITLGIGSFSKVKLAIHEPTRKRVAIKIFNKKNIRSMEMESKVEFEISILASLNHPHIVRLYEAIRTQWNIFIVMEYVPRGELFDYIVSNGRLSESEGRKYFQQLICAIQYCHYKGIVHRDLRPENILLDDDNNLRIADFGLSNKMKDGFFLKTSCGSPNYAAPEVICDEPYGPEVDIWSCGVILYAMLCGSLPFDDESVANLFRKIKLGTYKTPIYLSKGATNLIQRMLRVHPLKRITIDQIKQNWWFKRHLPKYMQNQSNKSDPSDIADSNIVAQLSNKLDIQPFEVEEALKKGSKLLCNHKQLATRSRHRYVAVCYHLLNDERHRKTLSASLTVPLQQTDFDSMNNTNASAEHNAYYDPYYAMKCYDHYNNIQWVIGVQTSSYPQMIGAMQHLLETLKLIEMEWFYNAPFCIVTRKKKEYENKENIENKNQIKIQIQLYHSKHIGSAVMQRKSIHPSIVSAVKAGVYRIIESLPYMNWVGICDSIANNILLYHKVDSPASNCILDIQRISGHSFAFMRLCVELMGAMNIKTPI